MLLGYISGQRTGRDRHPSSAIVSTTQGEREPVSVKTPNYEGAHLFPCPLRAHHKAEEILPWKPDPSREWNCSFPEGSIPQVTEAANVPGIRLGNMSPGPYRLLEPKGIWLPQFTEGETP